MTSFLMLSMGCCHTLTASVKPSCLSDLPPPSYEEVDLTKCTQILGMVACLSEDGARRLLRNEMKRRAWERGVLLRCDANVVPGGTQGRIERVESFGS